jgi:hypothetical protein
LISLFLIDADHGDLGFNLINKTDRAIKINWDDISFVSPRGKANRVVHTGIRYIERDATQAPTTVPPGAKLIDALTPVVLIYYSDGLNLGSYGTYGQGWKTAPLFQGYNKIDIENKEMSLYLPLEISGEKKEYNFTFGISNVRQVGDSLRDLKK